VCKSRDDLRSLFAQVRSGIRPSDHPHKPEESLKYRDHARESNQPIPDEPVLFAKFANSVIGAGEPIRVPAAAAERVDYEAELCAVVGRRAREVRTEEALSYVAGYTCANDVSARDGAHRNSPEVLTEIPHP